MAGALWNAGRCGSIRVSRRCGYKRPEGTNTLPMNCKVGILPHVHEQKASPGLQTDPARPDKMRDPALVHS